jgi:YD repeat-containing protein
MQKYLAVTAAILAAFSCSHVHAQTLVAGFTPGSFRVTEGGGAEYAMPIRIPPGIAGMEPKITLTFNSQHGNSRLGLGGALGGFSAISRCSKTIVQDGFTGGVNYDAHDRYCLDGQRLVAVNGTHGANGAEYRTERESFTKVVSYGGTAADPAWFKIWTKSGQIFEYGNTADSRIEAQGKSQARTWALNKASDTKGNYFTVTYAKDAANGDFHPTRMDYTGNAGASVNPFASVRFTYGPRTDTMTTYVGGSVLRTMNRLTNIKTYVGETVVTDYRLSYESAPTSGSSRPVSVTECSGNGTQCLPVTSFGWTNAAGGGIQTSAWDGGGYPGHLGWPGRVGDVNGDGLSDLVTRSDANVYIRYSTGSGFASAVYLAQAPSLGEDITDHYLVGDFNGDGRADIYYPDHATMYVSTASGISAVSWSGGAFGKVADVNGDGRADIVAGSGSGIYVYYSTGTSFQSPVYAAPRPAFSDGEGGTVYHDVFVVGDFNGDSRADIVIPVSGSVHLSTPAGFVSQTWANATWSYSFTFPNIVWAGQSLDINGDGRSDILVGDLNNGVLYLRTSNGNGFDAPLPIGPMPVYGEEWRDVLHVGDFDGNGRADFIGYSWPNWTAYLPSGGTPDRLTSITTSSGATIAVTYKLITDSTVYAKDTDAVWPVKDLRAQGPLDVVASTSSSNGIGGNRVTNYFYRGAKAHVKGGGFLGFRQIEVTDAAAGIKSVSTKRQDYPYQGLATQSQRSQPSGAVLGQAENTWITTSLTPATGSGGNYHKVELAQSVQRGYELNGNLISTVTTGTTYDSLGNALTVTTGTGDGYSKVTTNTYEAANTTDWILGRLATASVTASMPSPGVSLTRASSFQYDSASGLLTKEIVEPGSSTHCLVTAYTYDAFGNKASATTRNCNGSGGEAFAPTGDAVFAARTSTTSFAATATNPTPGQFPTSSANALTHAETKEFDARFGTVTKLTGPNGLATTWTYDLFGRKATETRADGTTTAWTYASCGACPVNGRYFVTVTSSGQPTASSYFDTLNREIRTESQGFDGTLVRKDTEYNALGQVLRTSRPYYAGQTPQWTSFTYDTVGRVLTSTEPNNAVTTTTHNGLTTTTTNHLGQTEVRTKNSQGQLVQVTRQ